MNILCFASGTVAGISLAYLGTPLLKGVVKASILTSRNVAATSSGVAAYFANIKQEALDDLKQQAKDKKLPARRAKRTNAASAKAASAKAAK